MRSLGLLFLSVFAAGPLLAQEHGYTAADIETGARLYEQNCTVCHGLDGADVADVALGTGRFRNAQTDAELVDLIQEGIAGTAMPPSALSREQIRAIVAYLRTWDGPAPSGEPIIVAAEPGEAARGEAVFAGEGQCLSCHWLDGNGSRLGPDLSDIGRQRNAADLERSLLDPNAQQREDYRFVLATGLDDEIIIGRLLNRDSVSLQLLDENERLRSLPLADLHGFSFMSSPMPAYGDELSDQALADLVAFLLTLRGDQGEGE